MARYGDPAGFLFLQPHGALTQTAEGLRSWRLDERDLLLAELNGTTLGVVVAECWLSRWVMMANGRDRGAVGLDMQRFAHGGVPRQSACMLTAKAMEWLDPILHQSTTAFVSPEADWILDGMSDGPYQWTHLGVTMVADWQQGVVTRLAMFQELSEPALRAWMYREQVTQQPTVLSASQRRWPEISTC